MFGFARNGTFNLSDFFGVVSKLGDHLRVAVERAADFDLDREKLAVFLTLHMQTWDPEVRGRKLLDDDARRACAAFLAGVAVNFVSRGAP